MIEFKEQDSDYCDSCSIVSDELTLIESTWAAMNLCDKCMQQLNRQIVEHLTDKYI